MMFFCEYAWMHSNFRWASHRKFTVKCYSKTVFIFYCILVNIPLSHLQITAQHIWFFIFERKYHFIKQTVQIAATTTTTVTTKRVKNQNISTNTPYRGDNEHKWHAVGSNNTDSKMNCTVSCKTMNLQVDVPVFCGLTKKALNGHKCIRRCFCFWFFFCYCSVEL